MPEPSEGRVVSEQPTLETWAMKAERLARERKQLAAAMGDPTKVKRKDREAWQRKKYELERHIKDA